MNILHIVHYFFGFIDFFQNNLFNYTVRSKMSFSWNYITVSARICKNCCNSNYINFFSTRPKSVRNTFYLCIYSKDTISNGREFFFLLTFQIHQFRWIQNHLNFISCVWTFALISFGIILFFQLNKYCFRFFRPSSRDWFSDINFYIIEKMCRKCRKKNSDCPRRIIRYERSIIFF